MVGYIFFYCRFVFYLLGLSFSFVVCGELLVSWRLGVSCGEFSLVIRVRVFIWLVFGFFFCVWRIGLGDF